MSKTALWIIVGFVLLAAGGGFYFFGASREPGKYDTFAQCLKDKGALFYGAFWCPHCQNQKALFGKSSKLLPYVECSTPDGNSQTETCKRENIKGYPTWQYPDGSRETGEVSLARLAAQTGCVLP